MRDIQCVCKICGCAFVWTHKDRMEAVKEFHPAEALFDTSKFKVQTGRMKRPDTCGGFSHQRGKK